MTWTYDPTALATTDLYQVRFFLGDTDAAYPQLVDEEISFTLALRGNVYGATSMCAKALAGKYSRLVSTSADGVSVQNGEKAKAYAALAEEYRGKEVLYYGTPYAGGISQDDMRTIISDPDRVPDLFRYGMFDNPTTDGVDPARP